jgi:hypothetical protein
VSRRRFISRLPRILLASVIAAVGFVGAAPSQASPNEAELKAAFVYNFLKFVDWPTYALGAPNAPLSVAIAGDGEAADAAFRFLDGKQVGNHAIAVRRVKVGDPLEGIHAVFFAESDTAKVQRALATMNAAAILTIGDDQLFAARGGMIAVFVEERKIRFEVNAGATGAKGLRVSSRLLALAKTVHAAAAGGKGDRP